MQGDKGQVRFWTPGDATEECQAALPEYLISQVGDTGHGGLVLAEGDLEGRVGGVQEILAAFLRSNGGKHAVQTGVCLGA